MKTCVVIPAAGRGTRLNQSTPKILTQVTKTSTVWSILRSKLKMADHIHVIVSPQNESLIRQALIDDLCNGFVSMSVQPEPIGMGDAIFRGYSVWSLAERILVVWGDQVFVSQHTLTRALEAQANATKTIAIPLVPVDKPYVEYVLTADSHLTQIKQSREGDTCAPQGLADVGTFVLSVADLLEEWHAYLLDASEGLKTNEINFLPFLPFLSNKGWRIRPVQVADATEARGINTLADLDFFRQLYEGMLL